MMYLNIVTKDRQRLRSFCIRLKRKATKKLLPVFYAELQDGTFFLGMLFNTKPEKDTATENMPSFEHIYETKEDYSAVSRLAKFRIMVDFEKVCEVISDENAL